MPGLEIRAGIWKILIMRRAATADATRFCVCTAPSAPQATAITIAIAIAIAIASWQLLWFF